jgi:hypothetical protein
MPVAHGTVFGTDRACTRSAMPAPVEWNESLSHAEPCDVLSELMLTLRCAVARLEALASERETAALVDRWMTAQRCAREVALVFEALGGAPTSARLPLARGFADPFSTIVRAYDRALSSELPRAVRALLLEHQTALSTAGHAAQLAA